MKIELKPNAKHWGLCIVRNNGKPYIEIPFRAIREAKRDSLSKKNANRVKNSFAYKKAIRQIIAAAEYSRDCQKIRNCITNGWKIDPANAIVAISCISCFELRIPLVSNSDSKLPGYPGDY